MRGHWRYRIGDLHLWAEIGREEIVILVLAVGHWSEIYDHVRRRAGRNAPPAAVFYYKILHLDKFRKV